MEKKTKAVGLFSGGLDSILAARLLLEQGIEVEGICFTTVFSDGPSKNSVADAALKAAKQLKIPLKVEDLSGGYLDILKNPRYGYGSGMNPCIDCRIFFLKRAKNYMEERGAAFIFTGEVVGQRPMSQRKEAMNIVERESGLEGLLLRPLCARLFKPTIAEKAGLVDREKLPMIVGRSRREQITLAKRFNIADYPSSGGGCLLTAKDFAKRVEGLFKNKPDFSVEDAALLKYGRHFRFSEAAKLIVSRNEKENHALASLKRDNDVLFYAEEPLGPVAILRGASNGEFSAEAAAITSRYALGKGKSGRTRIKYFRDPTEAARYMTAAPIEDAELEALRV